MNNSIPKCPRCPEGGNVKLVTEETGEAALAPAPGHVRKAELFQCSCGWTMVRTKPPDKRPGDD